MHRSFLNEQQSHSSIDSTTRKTCKFLQNYLRNMIFPLSKALLILSVGLFLAPTDVASSETHAARSEDGLASNSTTHRHDHSLGEIKPAKGGAPTASNPVVPGHRYTPGQNRPVFAHPTESSAESTTQSKSVAARQFVDLNPTTSTLTTTTGVRSISTPVTYSPVMVTTEVPKVVFTTTLTIHKPAISQSSPGTTTFASLTTTGVASGQPAYQSVTVLVSQKSTDTINSPAAQSSSLSTAFASATTTGGSTGAASDSFAYQSVTIMLTQESSGVLPQSETLTGPPLSLLPCKGPAAGPGLTPVGCTIVSSAETTPQPTTTYTWTEFNANSITRSLWGVHAVPVALASSTPSSNHSQPWTGDSTPCANNETWECVDTPSGILSLGPISQIFGAATGAPPSVPTSGNHSQDWTSNSSPCANNRSMECVANGSNTTTPEPIVSLLTAFQPSSNINALSTGNGLFPTILPELSMIVSTISSTTMASPTTSRSDIPSTPASIPWILEPSRCASNSSLKCLVHGTSTFVVGTLGLPPQTVSQSFVPCAQNTTLSCLVDGSYTMTVGRPPHKISLGFNSGSMFPSSNFTSSSVPLFNSQSTATVVVTPPPAISSTLTMMASLTTSLGDNPTTSALGLPPQGRQSSTVPTTSGTTSSPPHVPYPYPRASNGVKKIKVPTFLVFLCFLATIVASIDIQSISSLAGRSDPGLAPRTSTNVNYAPLISSLEAIISSSTEADGNWGIGVPPAATSAAPPQNGQYGGGNGGGSTTAAPQNSLYSGGNVGGPTSTAPPNGQIAGGNAGEPTSPASTPAATSFTHVVSILTSSFSPFPSNFIQPVTGSGTEAPVVTPSLPESSTAAKSGASNVKIPLFLLFLCTLASIAAAPINPRGLIGPSEITFSSASPTSWYSSTPDNSSTAVPQGPVPVRCVSNTNLECVIQGTRTFTVETLSPQTTQSTLATTILLATTTSLAKTTSAPPKSSKTATSGSSKMKVPSFLLFFYSLALLAAATVNPSPRGLIGPGEINFTSAPFQTSEHSANLTISTIATTAPTTEIMSSSTLNDASATPQVPNPIECASNTSLMCVVQGTRTFTVGTLVPQATLTTVPSIGVGFPHSATSASPTSSKIGSGASKVKIPSFLVFLSSFVNHAAADSFPIPPNYRGGSARFQSETTSQELRRIATPFLLLMLLCAAATLFSAGIGRKKHRKREEHGGYDSGWVVQRGEHVDSAHEERKGQ